MLTRARFLLLYVLFWALFFEVARALFFLYEWQDTIRLAPSLVLGALLHGLPMDLSSACALSLVAICLIARDGFLSHRVTRDLLVAYTVVALFIASLAVVIDLEIFKVWGFRIDSSWLNYLGTPREAFASAGGSPLLLLAAILVALITAAVIAFRLIVLPSSDAFPQITQRQSLLFITFLLPAVIIVVDGGFRWRVPMTASSVFFSRDPFANRAAVNPLWNFAVSLASRSDENRIEAFASPSVATRIVDSLLAQHPPPGDRTARTRLLVRRPSRILILIWEGLTAKIVEPLGGMPGVTPGLTRLAKEGILFDSVFASGFRTTNGLVAVLSGFPSHPRSNPLSSYLRSASLPSLSTELAAAGYRTGFYYGAPLEFDNRSRYILSGHYDEIVEKKDIDPANWGSPWGAHDPYTLSRVFGALDSARGPVFAVTLTLSSHEPFSVPAPVRIAGSDSEHRFLNAQAFTDDAVSSFVQRLKTSGWWDRTLVVIVADHGSPYPFREPRLAAAPEQHRIPMLWIGGVLATRDTVVRHTLSQFDIPSILLGQLGLPSKRFIWGKDIFAPGATSFAFYSVSNGFGFVDRTGSFVFDNSGQSIVQKTGQPSNSAVAAGRAFQQLVTQAYLDMSRPARH